jgi:hypothetical protein
MNAPVVELPPVVVELPPGLVNSNTGVFLCDVAALVTMVACVPTLGLYYRRRRWGDLVRERGRLRKKKRGRPGGSAREKNCARGIAGDASGGDGPGARPAPWPPRGRVHW